MKSIDPGAFNATPRPDERSLLAQLGQSIGTAFVVCLACAAFVGIGAVLGSLISLAFSPEPGVIPAYIGGGLGLLTLIGLLLIAER